MPSTPDTEQDSRKLADSDLIAYLALYQDRQDKAQGVTWVSGKTRGLLWYWGQAQTERLDWLYRAAFLNGIVQQCTGLIKALVKKAETASDKRKIAQQVIELQERAMAAKEELDQLSDNASPRTGQKDVGQQ